MLPFHRLKTVRRHVFQKGAAQSGISLPPVLEQCARLSRDEVLRVLETRESGLGDSEVEARRERFGPNHVVQEEERGWRRRVVVAVRNPLVILLSVLAVISFATAREPSDLISGGIIVVMVIIGVAMRFVQETRADAAAAKLQAMITVTATVIREGHEREVRIEELVPGDVVRLAAGDLIPGDVRLLTAKDVFVTQASLTGESLPVEKSELAEPAARPPLEYRNLCYLGTSLQSGSATGVVLTTGTETYFGRMARTLAVTPPPTSFEQGINRFTWLMIHLMMAMVPLVFVINALTKTAGPVSYPFGSWEWFAHRNWSEAFLFALAVAVGLTPEMLPSIVSVCLSKGAIEMSRKKVIVKRINSIQNFGAMDVLCADKTGTLTIDRVILERHCDVVGDDSEEVLTLAFLISHFQTGLKNVLDRAVLDYVRQHAEIPVERYAKLDELPFDFSRRVMSVVIDRADTGPQLLCKGAPEAIFSRCTGFELHGELLPMDHVAMDDLREEYERLSAEGFRVLAVASKKVERRAAYTKDDESELVLQGYVAFLDPPKETAKVAIELLQKRGVTVKVLTGDNELVTKKICSEVGLSTERVLLGSEVEKMSEAELSRAVADVSVLARLSPLDKERVVLALKSAGHVVGFMGDGINDAPGLRVADVSISVDSAVDVAKETADVILLEKSLLVLVDGVVSGRKVFANIVKYVRMGASSNFGNMFSVVGASALFPFVPMRPIQILTNNLLYDFSQTPIPTDDVDEEQIRRPKPWQIDELRRFILCFGPISSIFDYTTYALMWFVFRCRLLERLVAPAGLPAALLRHLDPSRGPDGTYAAALFQTGWFVESLMTQTLIIHVIRTNKLPFIQSVASWPLIVNTAVIMAIGVYLPFSPLGGYLSFAPLPALYWPLLLGTLFAYLALTQLVKTWLLRKAWI